MDEELRIQAPLESAFAALLLTCLPGLLYLVVHFSVLSEGRHTWSVLLLFSVPTLYLSILKVHIHPSFLIFTSLCSSVQQLLPVQTAEGQHNLSRCSTKSQSYLHCSGSPMPSSVVTPFELKLRDEIIYEIGNWIWLRWCSRLDQGVQDCQRHLSGRCQHSKA